MGISVSLEPQGRFIVGRVSEAVNHRLAIELAEAYAKMIEKTAILLILNDMRGTPNHMGTVEDYNYAYKDVKMTELPYNIKSAILTDPDDKSHDFQAMVAQNAGYLVRQFKDYDRAVEWLIE